VGLTVFLAMFGLRMFSYFPVVVLTGSMAGAVDRGSIVFVEKLNAADVLNSVNEGDIIHYKYKNNEVMHRIIEFRYNESGERLYITKGDANPIADSIPVKAGQILGISRSYIPYAGYPLVILNAIFNN